MTMVPMPGVGEELEQQHVGNPPVEDVGPADAAPHGGDAGLDLGDHAAAQRAVGDERLELAPPSSGG